MRDEGYATTTVSAVAERAGVSRRTFFNYYATKEDAVLGLGEPAIPHDVIDEILTGPDQIGKAARLVGAVAASVRHVPMKSADRRELLEAVPELRARARTLAMTAQDLLADAIKERYDGDDAERASALAMLGAAVIRFAYIHNDIDVLDNPDSPAVADAIAVFRTTIKDLT